MQFAIFDTDPVAAFKTEINKAGMRAFYRRQLEQAANANREAIERSSQMSMAWDALFRGITGDRTHVLVSNSRPMLSGNDAGGKKWIVTKVARIDGKPVCWCVPVELKKGEQVEVNLTAENRFDLGAAFDNAMQESEPGK